MTTKNLDVQGIIQDREQKISEQIHYFIIIQEAWAVEFHCNQFYSVKIRFELDPLTFFSVSTEASSISVCK